MIKNMFNRGKKEEEVKPLPSPLGLRIGGILDIDTLDIELFFGGKALMDISQSKNLKVTGYVVVDLDDAFIHRYTFDGGFIEFMGNEDCSEFDEESITWYQNISSQALLPSDLELWIGEEEGLVGNTTFTLEGENGDIDYSRVLFDDNDENITLNVDAKEYTTDKDFVSKNFETMLFGRDIEDGDDCEAEFLIAEVELSDDSSLANIYVGVTITSQLIETM